MSIAKPHPVYPHVFQPVRVGAVELRNRIFVPAHTTNYGENNLPSDRHLAYHRARAAGGAGLIIFEGIRVHRSSLGRQQGVNGYERAAISRFHRLAEAVRAEGSRLFGQIIHLGRHIDGNYARMPAWSASAIPWSATAPAPHPMTSHEIDEVVDAHADVAANLIEAGLDGIELQVAHGHLLQQFLSPASNRRQDAYGGSFENRLRFPLRTLRAIRERIGGERCLGIRISADEFMEGGLTLDDMCAVVVRLAREVQVDFVNVSHSAYHGSYTVSTQMADMGFLLETFQPLTQRIRAALDQLPARPVVMTACRYQAVSQAEAMLASGGADMIGMARAHIADPEIVDKARTGRERETTPCIGCNQGCAGMLAQSLAITCLTNPAAGREAAWPEPARQPASRSKRILVVGGGPGGMEAAATAAARGHEVALWERDEQLGGALRWTLRMPLRSEFKRLLDRQQARLVDNGVILERCHEATVDAVLAHDPDIVIWATGAEPIGQPLQSDGAALTLEAALDDPDALGRRVLLVDGLGTWSVVSVAEHLADLGKDVTLVAPTGAPGWTISMYSSFALRARLRQKRVRIIAGHALVAHRGENTSLEDLSLGEIKEGPAVDSVVAPLAGSPRMALGEALTAKLPQDASMRQLSIGDCSSPRTALEAVFEGHEAARRL
jgi:2,4-dienoyl-CoA reductase-like NADH-dependent reductase (Old Yellow Enzyme family)/thioredoxin reductase